MPNAENAKLQYEAGQTVYPMTALTNSGDAKLFTSAASLWSAKSGRQVDVKPNGLATGGAVAKAASNTNNAVDVAALTCYLAGVKTAVSADNDVLITRPATNVSKVNSLTVNSSGAIAVVAGADGTTTAFSETRGANGGPPYIPVGSIEIGQVRVTTSANAPVTESQVFTVVGLHVERYDSPIWTENNATASMEFSSPLPLIHTGDEPKGVFASFADPVFTDIQLASDFVPPENSYSVSSTQIYGTTLGSSSASLGQGSFTAYLTDGISDPLVALSGEDLWFKFYPNRYQSNHILAQGKLGISRTFPAADNIQASCTISASRAATGVIV
jgi:hypothetical protein